MIPTSNSTGAKAVALHERSAASQPSGGAPSCPATLAVLLAGRSAASRSAQFATSLGLPTAALPVDAERNIAERWIALLAQAGFRGNIVIAVSDANDGEFYGRLALPENLAADAIAVEVRADSSAHRGPAGTVGDAWRAFEARTDAASRGSGVIVIEGSNAPNFDVRAFVAAIRPETEALIGAAVDATPSGISYFSRAALALVPTVGYFDLKEQLVPAASASGMKVSASFGTEDSCRISDRESYLRAVAMMLGANAPAIAAGATVHPDACVRGNSIVCRGAAVGARALVIDSVLLPGSAVGSDAVVARSVVPPASHIPNGYLIVDEVFGALGSAAKTGTEGGAS